MRKTGPAESFPEWDNVRVCETAFETLTRHYVFLREPKAANIALYWLRDLDAAVERNRGHPVSWPWKDLQNRFRAYKHSYTLFCGALKDLGLITLSTSSSRGNCRQFAIRPEGRIIVADSNFWWLAYLLQEPDARRHNQVAISRRKRTRRVYADPIKRTIDAFNHAVRFDQNRLLAQLRSDRAHNAKRYRAALHHLLAIERRDFGELELKGGRIYNVFSALPLEYRIIGKLKRRVYVAVMVPTLTRSDSGTIPKHWKEVLMLDPELYEYAESVGLTLAYEYDRFGVFGIRGDAELPAKLELVKASIQRKSAEKLGCPAAVKSAIVKIG